MNEVKHSPCLVLNQDYTPLLVINWQRAICLQIIGKEVPGEGIRIEKYYDDEFITSAGGEKFEVAAVAVSGRYVKRRRKIALKKRNLLIRDERTCQYCGHEVNPKSSTIDHVKPRSHFSRPGLAHTWDNTVIACIRCNSSKDNRTPQQAHMKLLTVPKEPDYGSFYAGMSPWATRPPEWEEYLMR